MNTQLRNFALGLCALGLAATVGCNKKSETTAGGPAGSSEMAAGDTRSGDTRSGTSRPSSPSNPKSDTGPLGVHPPESTPPADSRGGSGTGTPTGPGSALPSGTSTDGSQP